MTRRSIDLFPRKHQKWAGESKLGLRRAVGVGQGQGIWGESGRSWGWASGPDSSWVPT
jgi:hypothetical protein